MKLTLFVIAFTAINLQQFVLADYEEIFVDSDALERVQRVRRQSNADQMVQNILQWLQGVYTQNSRKIRQGTLREYLPPSNTQRPRPFEPNNNNGYPPAGITPQPPFNIYTNPTTGAVTGEGSNNGYPQINQEINPPYHGPSSQQPSYNGAGPSTGYPTGRPGITNPTYLPPATNRPGFPTKPPVTPPPQDYSTGYPSQKPGFPTAPPQGYPTQPPQQSFPTRTPPSYPTQPPQQSYPTRPPPTYPTQGYPQGPTSTQGYPTSTYPPKDYSTAPPTPGPVSTSEPVTISPITSQPNPNPSTYYTSPDSTTEAVESQTPSTGTSEENNVIGGDKPESSDDKTTVTSAPPSDEDLKHPPHIHAIDVECAKDMMTITIEFNREFNGVIYSKGHYSTPECRYVNENSEQTKYKFTVSLNSCGTEFINAFDTQNQSYLENILVIQNEVGIQEVWDTVRSVRCLWEGNLKDSLSVALSVGMLSQEIVTFSGDTAMAKLDIQLGKGPFAQPANGLVKIGEPMTLVISVSGDPGFDIQVKDCRATDASGDNVYPLTDENGCILKPKLFGAFQKTRNTQNTGASIIAYAFFNAFKFPDVMDLMIQCNIELCKTDCQMCPNGNQQLEPGRRRRRRDLSYYQNQTGDGSTTMGRSLRVVLPADLETIEEEVLNINHVDGVCMSTQNFVLSSVMMVSILVASCIFSASMWVKNQRAFNKI